MKVSKKYYSSEFYYIKKRTHCGSVIYDLFEKKWNNITREWHWVVIRSSYCLDELYHEKC
ncbi:MAG: hypothetical protein ACRCXT_00910 [Paraclostridium sp.]